MVDDNPKNDEVIDMDEESQKEIEDVVDSDDSNEGNKELPKSENDEVNES